VQTPDEGYIAVGRAEPFGVLAMRLNKFGDVIWTRYFSGFAATKIESTYDGHYIILAAPISIIKININGDTLWTKSLTLNYALATIKQSLDSGYILCGTADNGPYTAVPYLLKVNSQGAFQWEKTFTNGIGDGRFADITIAVDSGFVLCGNYSPGKDTIYDYLFIMKTDNNGNQIWFKGYDTLVFRLTETIINAATNGYIVGGFNASSYLYKFDDFGNMQWSKFFDGPPRQGSCNQLINTVDRNYSLVGYLDTTGNLSRFVRLIKIDTLGNEQWRKVYGIQDYNTGEGLRQTSDSGFVIAGITSINNAEEDVYIIKTDKNGNTSPYIGIEPISTEVPIESQLYQNYPNPFNPITTIKYDIPQDNFVSVKIYDLLGREIFAVSEFKKAGRYEVKFDGSNFASGLYFFKIEIV
jgi:hypothetical protein